ncbi:MAG: HEAT repeat domain-containing protein [Planctomycetota bacterium]|nr:HEAT repeat domain-containing protein [Planctomycetota bacterium]
MSKKRRIRRLVSVGSALIAAGVCAAAFCFLRPFDAYLLSSWESQLATVSDEDVEVRLEQIAAIGERSWPTLVAALHSDRQIVAGTAGSVLQRELARLELRSTDETSPIIAGLARQLADRGVRPGPHSGHASTQLATRILLWPINRKLIDGERLVADCELIIRSAKQPQQGRIADSSAGQVEGRQGFSSSEEARLSTELLTPLAGGGLPVQLVESPPLPPQTIHPAAELIAPSPTEPQQFPVQAPRVLDVRQRVASGEATKQSLSKPPAVDSRQSLDLRRDIAAAPTLPNLPAMSDLNVMRTLAGDDERLVREAVDELYRRGFQTKHFRLAELLVDPDSNVRLQLVQSLPQMSGIDSRPWLLWLSRDQDPEVCKAAVAVIATSADPSLQQRVRELEREETDDDVLQVVRQILNNRRTGTIR